MSDEERKLLEQNIIYEDTIVEQDKEIERLNNIINELEKYLNYNAKHIRNNINFKEVLDKIKELRGDSK